MLLPNLQSLAGVYRKLERERYRTWHAETSLHKADHFLNFCITAHSLREYTCEHLGKVKPGDTQPLHEEWNKQALLVEVGEIANTAKHRQLRTRGSHRTPVAATTRSISRCRTTIGEVLADSSGNLSVVPREVSDWCVTASDGRRFPLWNFMDEILGYWHAYLRRIGIRSRRQSLSNLRGG